jgi:uncharacterized protein YndB with AHSA1/START domain
MVDHSSSIAALRKAVTVDASPARAFELFTKGIQQWWPLPTHSVGEQLAASIAFGEGVGGTIVETLADGTTAMWGRVTRWEPPGLVAFTWHPGNPESEAGLVEVTFKPGGSGVTVVELVHTGWERRPDGLRARAGYDTGWNTVLSQFVQMSKTSGSAEPA